MEWFLMEMGDQRLTSGRTLVVSAAIVAAFGALLRLEGRPGWCKYEFGLWSAAWAHCTSQHVFDPYSLTHALHGVIFFWMLQPLASRVDLRWRLVGAIALEVAWELVENS